MIVADRSFLDKVRSNNRPQTGTVQSYTHKFLGSTNLTGEGNDRYNHRFGGATDEMTLIPGAPPWLIYSASNYRKPS